MYNSSKKSDPFKLARFGILNHRLIKSPTPDIIFIGDSITEGWEGNDPKAFGGYLLTKPIVHHPWPLVFGPDGALVKDKSAGGRAIPLAGAIKSYDKNIRQGIGGWNVWQKFYGKRNVLNFSIGGDSTEHLNWRLKNSNIKHTSPKVAVLLIGTNNGGNPRQVETAIKETLQLIRKLLPNTKILLLGIFPRGGGPGQERIITGSGKRNQNVNKRLRHLADNKFIHYMNIWKNFLDENGNLGEGICDDGLHLTEKGYLIWAESIEEKLNELLS